SFRANCFRPIFPQMPFQNPHRVSHPPPVLGGGPGGWSGKRKLHFYFRSVHLCPALVFTEPCSIIRVQLLLPPPPNPLLAKEGEQHQQQNNYSSESFRGNCLRLSLPRMTIPKSNRLGHTPLLF